MWKFLAMRYHSALMREYAHFHITEVKKNPHFGPIFWPLFDKILTFLLRILTVFARAPAPQFRSIFYLVFAYYAHTDFVFRIASAYAHQSAYFRTIRIRMAITNSN